jgi:hypothetical protein
MCSPVRRRLLPFAPATDPESGVGIRVDAPRRPRPLDGRGVFSRVRGSSFSLSDEFMEMTGLMTE